MHPWEFKRYGMQEFLDKLNGFRKYTWVLQREQWEMTRAIAYENAIMQGKMFEKKPTIKQYWTFPWDKKGAVELDPKNRLEQILENRRKYLKAARNSRDSNGKKDRGNNRRG